uniref:microtubule-associated protein futsch-like isoform X1 n=1 Tax=Monopterus albus TaxID=43700 RepID=UPI0009B40A94|nr:microtubule-associated protein futsch-like isoform X1 [Monopterus albus]
MMTERKCQSLGTDGWRPAMSFRRQLSQSDGERWIQEQQWLHARTPEGMAIHPKTKAKSQSLPRMLQPESLQYVDIASSGQELFRRVSGQPQTQHNLYRAPRWLENGRPASANQLSMTPKPRFTRPPRPPSYEMHQQIRGSCEVLSGRDSAIPQARDRTPLPISRTGDPQLNYFVLDSGPPGYIPPPSYKRAPIMAGGCQGYGEIAVDYRYRGDVYHKIQVASDGSHWFTRHPAGSWPDPQKERCMSSQKQVYPVYTTQERPSRGVQYIPFDDSRIRHVSSALGGNSLTDADKIRHICNELPSVTVSEPAFDKSAFLPPPLGPFITAKVGNDASMMSSSDFNNDNNRWHSDLHKEIVDNFPVPDLNCNNGYPKNQRPPPSLSSTFQTPLIRTSSHQGSSSDIAETITQVKKIVRDLGPESNRNTKGRVSETIFCLVSVPIHMPGNINKDLVADQNNNETITSLTVTNPETFTVSLKETPNIRNKYEKEMPIKPHYTHFHTSSRSSMRNYKRAPLRKEIIDAWALQASEDKELYYAGSWPGNQYRNQETQTGSPLTVIKSPGTQSPPQGQAPVQSASDNTTDSGVVTESSISYGYPMAGQKNLHPSSNSAFSRLSLSQTQLPPLQPSQQDPCSPSKAWDKGDQQPSSSRRSSSSPPESAEQVTFGQFLLKPVNRRPCDAIGELESINKEMEDTISKRPSVGQCTDYLVGVKKRLDHFKSGAHFSIYPEPGREAISLPPVHTEKVTNIKVRSRSVASTVDLDSMNMRSVFSRSQATNMPPTNELSILFNPGPTDNCLLSLPPHNTSNRLYRQDIPVLHESLLTDVGLTVYTEIPGGSGEPKQCSLSAPSPVNRKDLSQSVQLSLKTRTANNSGIPEHSSNKDLQLEVDTESTHKLDKVPASRGDVNLNIRRTRSESRRSPQKEGSPYITRQTRKVSFVSSEDDDDNEKCTISEPLTYKDESTMADKHLEDLLIQEKVNTLPAEDLSNLYEVKCAKGIPENESIEQRAARILGIDVAVEALGVADKHSEDIQDKMDTPESEKELSPTEKTQQVIGQGEQVQVESLIVQEAETKEAEETGSSLEQEEGNRYKHSTNHDGEDNQDPNTQSAVVLDLPEFPPSKLPLSLPVTTDKMLALSMCSGEKKRRGVACKLTDSMQDKLSSSASLSATSLDRSTTDRMACLKGLETMSQKRSLCFEGSESGDVHFEERNRDGDESEIQQEKIDYVEEKQEEEAKKLVERRKEVEISDKHKNSHETYDILGDPEEYSQPKELKQGICKEKQSQEEETKETKVELTHIEESKDVDVELKTEKPEGDVELETGKDDKEKHLVKVSDGQNAEVVSRTESSQNAEEEKPKPKQRTRLQKPPLLPKPRSVPKREITLPLSFSTETCSPSNMEDEEVFSVSDTYDPSRVERV